MSDEKTRLFHFFSQSRWESLFFDRFFSAFTNKVFFFFHFQGTVWYSMFKWRVVANLTSSLGYDASCLGNHEFDDGVADLEAFSNAIEDSYPLLGTIHKLRSKHKLNRGRRRKNLRWNNVQCRSKIGKNLCRVPWSFKLSTYSF